MDWTQDPVGRSNSSELFIALEKRITEIIINDAFFLITGQTHRTAGLILAQLAHRYGFGPIDEAKAREELGLPAPLDDNATDTAQTSVS